MFAYQTGPIDFFEGCIPLNEYLRQVTNSNKVLSCLIREMANMRDKKECYWEGDIREGVYVFAIPLDGLQMDIGFIWKQDNNGTTFILSPEELPWLREHII